MTNASGRSFRLWTAVICGCAAFPIWAQESRGVIAGRVSDAMDAAVVGAEIRATNVDTGIAASATSGDGGGFRIPFLIPGAYRVTVEFAGFKKVSMDRVEVRVGETLDLPVRLEVGNVAETVEVTGGAVRSQNVVCPARDVM